MKVSEGIDCTVCGKYVKLTRRVLRAPSARSLMLICSRLQSSWRKEMFIWMSTQDNGYRERTAVDNKWFWSIFIANVEVTDGTYSARQNRQFHFERKFGSLLFPFCLEQLLCEMQTKNAVIATRRRRHKLRSHSHSAFPTRGLWSGTRVLGFHVWSDTVRNFLECCMNKKSGCIAGSWNTVHGEWRQILKCLPQSSVSHHQLRSIRRLDCFFEVLGPKPIVWCGLASL